MTAYETIITKTAGKQFKLFDTELQKRIRDGVKALSEDPFKNRSGCDVRKLALRRGEFYRLRVGDYRIIYVVENKKVMITKILHRKNVYELM